MLKILYMAVFEVAVHDLAIKISIKSSKEAWILAKINIQGFSRSLIKNLLLEIGLQKFKMAEQICPLKTPNRNII